MKQIFKNLVLIAAAAVALTSCQKDPIVPPTEEGFQISAMATIGADTKTSIEYDSANEQYKVLWSESDAITLYEMSYVVTGEGDSETLAEGGLTYNNYKGGIKGTFSDDLTTAEFKGITMPETPGANDNLFDYFAIYGKVNTVYGRKSFGTMTLTMPNIQYPSMNQLDPQATVMLAKSIGHSERQSTLNLNFNHVAAYVQLNILGMDIPEETIEKIEIISDNHYLSGNYWLNWSDYTVEDATSNHKNIILDVADMNVAADGDQTFYFGAIPTKFVIGDKVTIKITTDVATYTKEVQIPTEEYEFELEIGKMLQLNVRFDGFELPAENSGTKYELVTDASTLAEGDEVIFVGQSSNTYYAAGAPNANSSTNTFLKAITVTAPSENAITITDEEIDTFTLEASGSFWKFKSTSQSAYIGYVTTQSSNNMSYTASAVAEWTVSISENAARIVLNGKDSASTERYFQFNTNSNQQRFCAYTPSSNMADAQIYRKVVEGDTNTPPSSEPTVYKPVMSADEITDDGSYLVAVKVGSKYMIANNEPYSSSWLQGVDVTWNTEAGGITDLDAVAAYDWTITNTDKGYLLYINQMTKNSITGQYVIAMGGSGSYVSNTTVSGEAEKTLGKFFFNPESGIETAGDRAYWNLTPDGTGITSFVSKYDRGSGSETYIKFAPATEGDGALFSLADDNTELNLDLVDIMLLKLQ